MVASTASSVVFPTADFTRVPYSVFVDQEVYEREQQRLFRGSTWCYLGLEAEIPNPGDFKTTVMGDTPVVLNRDRQGELRAFVNRCSHRGAIVRREACGNAKEHRCIYHQWCFNLKGELTGVPYQNGMQGKGGYPDDFDKSQHGLTPIRVESYKGIVFGSFDWDIEPLDSYLDTHLRYHFDKVFHKPVKVLGYMRQLIPGNWKLYFENVKDPYHAGLLHLFHATFGLYRSTQKGGVVLDKHQGHSIIYNIGGNYDKKEAEVQYKDQQKYEQSYKLVDPSILKQRPDFDDGVANRIMSVFPSVVVQQILNTLATRHIRPKGPDEFELYWTYFGYADDDEELTQIRLKQANFVGPSGFISMEDGEAVRLVQEGIRREQDQYSVIEMDGRGEIRDIDHLVSEVPMRGFWKRYAELMNYDVEVAQ
ncbi:Rieske 2Fe-2S domain-containing protein [Oscillatoria sp. FACHB-1407]|nr:Rieske 2Fe-2S domain-containing protein [Oscillatoria sp. FACHB-1407]